jgi:hypothetical protein
LAIGTFLCGCLFVGRAKPQSIYARLRRAMDERKHPVARGHYILHAAEKDMEARQRRLIYAVCASLTAWPGITDDHVSAYEPRLQSIRDQRCFPCKQDMTKFLAAPLPVSMSPTEYPRCIARLMHSLTDGPLAATRFWAGFFFAV